MSKNDDFSEQLREREERRKHSIVGSMINSPPLQPEQAPGVVTAEPGENKKPPENPGAAVAVKKTETRSRRKQILLQPTIHDRAEAKCKELDISMNEVINQLLQNWLDMD
jgi:hypothetical protein